MKRKFLFFRYAIARSDLEYVIYNLSYMEDNNTSVVYKINPPNIETPNKAY